MAELLIRGGLVLRGRGPIVADVLVGDGRILAVGPRIGRDGALEVDATGCWVGPGFVDLHTHLREPGQEHKEDIASGSAAAAAGGYTAIVAMPNTDPAIDTGALARFVTDQGEAAGLVEVVPSGTISVGRRGVNLADVDGLWAAGVRMFTDDGDTVADAALLRRAMERVAALGGVISQHAVDAGLASGGHLNEGAVAEQLGLGGVPSVAEEVVIQRDLALVRLTGARYHVQHVSVAGAIPLIASAKEEGLPVTAEVTPHHLTFDEREILTGGTMFKMMPPLRTPEDVEALRSALAEGVIDAVATDHAPHTANEKGVAFEEAPPGVTGLEWAAAAVNTSVALDIKRFFDRMSVAPARIADVADRHGRPVEPGERANLVVFDPAPEKSATSTVSRSANSPYLGRTWRGVVRRTIYAGVTTHVSEEDDA